MVSNMENVLNVAELVGSDSAFSPEFAEEIYQKACAAIDGKEIKTIDFSGIKVCPTAFLNIAIGRLFSKYTVDEIRQYIRLQIPTDQNEKFKLVVDSAKEKYGKED